MSFRECWVCPNCTWLAAPWRGNKFFIDETCCPKCGTPERDYVYWRGTWDQKTSRWIPAEGMPGLSEIQAKRRQRDEEKERERKTIERARRTRAKTRPHWWRGFRLGVVAGIVTAAGMLWLLSILSIVRGG